MATLIFEISWDPTVEAQLAALFDNDMPLLEAAIDDSDGRITLTWEADPDLPHFIQWELWSVGSTLKSLRAIAAWEDGTPALLGEAAEKHHRWSDGGSL